MTRGIRDTRTECSFAGCGRKPVAKGYCGGHWGQQHEGRPLTPLREVAPRGSNQGQACIFPGCHRQRSARGLCKTHDGQRRRETPLRTPVDRTPRPLLPNPAAPGTLLVPLTRGFFAVIDECDAVAVADRCWHVQKSSNSNTRYAAAADPEKGVIHLHRVLWKHWGLSDTPQIDHRDLDGLNCRRLNLRAATVAQNQFNRTKLRNNTSGYKGVSWHRGQQKWSANIRLNDHLYHLGTFDDPRDAAEAYAVAAREMHGEFARVA